MRRSPARNTRRQFRKRAEKTAALNNRNPLRGGTRL